MVLNSHMALARNRAGQIFARATCRPLDRRFSIAPDAVAMSPCVVKTLLRPASGTCVLLPASLVRCERCTPRRCNCLLRTGSSTLLRKHRTVMDMTIAT